MIEIYSFCRWCGTQGGHEMDATWEQIEDWRSGTLIQTAMPNLTAEDREILITGMCPPCQKEYFE